MTQPRILWVDDEEAVLRSMANSLRARYDVVPVVSAKRGLELLSTDPQIIVVISDLQMPELDGLAFLAEVRVRRPEVVRVLLTGNHERAAEIAATDDGLAFRVLTKPCPRDVLIEALDRAVAHHLASR